MSRIRRVRVSTPTIRSRILKGKTTKQEEKDERGFNPNDPFEDTESEDLARKLSKERTVSTPTIRSRILKAPSPRCPPAIDTSFNPNDPFEDTESEIYDVIDEYEESFNPNDPFEDTESSTKTHCASIPNLVSTPTIRSRILKDAPFPYPYPRALCFNPNDPFEDTESLGAPRRGRAAVWFQPQRSVRGY